MGSLGECTMLLSTTSPFSAMTWIRVVFDIVTGSEKTSATDTCRNGLTALQVVAEAAEIGVQQVVVDFVWNKPLADVVGQFQSKDVLALTGDDFTEVVQPISGLHAVRDYATEFAHFTMTFPRPPDEMTVQVAANATFDKTGNPSLPSNVVVIPGMTLEEQSLAEQYFIIGMECGDSLCYQGLCNPDNLVCICNEGFSHEQEWHQINDCSVPTNQRQTVMITAAVLSFLAALFALIRTVRMRSRNHPHRMLQRGLLMVIWLWGTLRVVFFVQRAFVEPFTLLDSLLLAIPMALTWLVLALTIEIYLSRLVNNNKRVATSFAFGFMGCLMLLLATSLSVLIVPTPLVESIGLCASSLFCSLLFLS